MEVQYLFFFYFNSLTLSYGIEQFAQRKITLSFIRRP